MARVPYLTREDLRPEDRGIFDGLMAERGTVMNLFRVLAHTPNLLRGLLAYSSQIRFHLTLDPHLRELAILTVGRLCRATYEESHHWNIARSAGVPREKLDALREYERSPVFTERERAVIRYSVEATRDVRVSDATFAKYRLRPEFSAGAYAASPSTLYQPKVSTVWRSGSTNTSSWAAASRNGAR